MILPSACCCGWHSGDSSPFTIVDLRSRTSAPVAQLQVHGRGEESDSTAPVVLGSIERGIGVGKERPDVLAVSRVDGYSDAQSELEEMHLDLDVVVKRGLQPGSEQFRGRRQRLLLGNRDELVTANSSPARPDAGPCRQSNVRRDRRSQHPTPGPLWSEPTEDADRGAQSQ